MTKSSSQALQHTQSLSVGRTAQILAAAFLGLTITFAVGFMPMDAAHNAAHDSRHSHAFPCH